MSERAIEQLLISTNVHSDLSKLLMKWLTIWSPKFSHISHIFFRISEVEPKYYADGEDAYAMRRNLVPWSQMMGIEPADPDSFFAKSKTVEDKKKAT